MFDSRSWIARLEDLASRIRKAARGALDEAFDAQDFERLSRPVRAGVGDVTYGLDERTEVALDLWFEEVARVEPISLMTEDQGWRHRGPAPNGRSRELRDFDHGGPRIAIDPVDGTRNLMADLRSAWVIVSFAPPGKSAPWMHDLEIGICSEIPDSRAARFRELVALRGATCEARIRELASDHTISKRTLTPTTDSRVDNGYFPFFHYLADQRPDIARVEAAFFERLAKFEGADVRTCYDDQYISSGGQLALVALGTYRAAIDIRTLVAKKRGVKTMTSKPYDLAGAVICAQSAGAIVTAVDGSPLDFPIDCETPVDFAAFANAATCARLAPHLARAIEVL